MKHLFVVLALLLGTTSFMLAQDTSMDDAMAEWMKYAEPGEHHKALDPMVGSWTISGRFRMAPDAEWMAGESKADTKWILGDRFIQQNVWSETADMGPVPFEGMGLMGYDNYREQYVVSWVDNHSTLLLTGTGERDEDAIVVRGTYADPITQSEKGFRWVYRISGPDQWVMEMYEPLPDGGEFMSGEMTYNRAQ